MSLFSKQAYSCMICRSGCERTCNDGSFFKEGVCGMRCLMEKRWRETLSILGNQYRPDPRDYDEQGYIKEKKA